MNASAIERVVFLARVLPSGEDAWMARDHGPTPDVPFLTIRWSHDVPLVRFAVRYLEAAPAGIVTLEWRIDLSREDPTGDEGFFCHCRRALEACSLGVVSSRGKSELLSPRLSTALLVDELGQDHPDAVQFLDRLWVRSAELRDELGTSILERYLRQPSASLAMGLVRLRFTRALDALRRRAGGDPLTSKLVGDLEALLEADTW